MAMDKNFARRFKEASDGEVPDGTTIREWKD